MSLALTAAAIGAVVLLWRFRRRPGSPRRRALAVVVAILGAQLLLGAPASAQSFDCEEPPNPERPGSGMVGVLDPAALGVGQSGSPYDEVGYAGLVWHTYGLGCGPQGLTNPNALVDTWLGNELFNVAKNIVGATNGLHNTLLVGNLMEPLDEIVATGTVALYDSVFAPFFALVALVLAVLLFRYIWLGDMATIGKRTMWALAGLWFASATYLTPMVYTEALDDVVITGTSAVQAGFLREVRVDERDALPTLLHNEVVYRNWQRGEFGDPDSPKAKELGRELLLAQAWTKEEVQRGLDAGSPEPKKQAFRDVAAKMGSATGTFQGTDGSRTGIGFLAVLQSMAYALFQLLAKAAILLAQVLLRVLILAGPLIGLVALVYHQVLRAVGRIAGAAMLNVVVISALAGLDTLVLSWIFSPQQRLEPLAQILLAGLVTIVFLMVGRPVRRMGQMVQLSVGSAGGSVPKMSGSLFSRFRGRGGGESQDDFWNQVRESDADEGFVGAARGGRRRNRPEAEYPVTATAYRLDQDGPRALPSGGPPEGAASGTPALPYAGGGNMPRPGTPRGAQALPEGHSTSRVVDTAPVADAKWDVHEEDPVLVPSRADGATPTVDPALSRRSEMEVVAGRQANVVYRPSSGLEVSDGGGS